MGTTAKPRALGGGSAINGNVLVGTSIHTDQIHTYRNLPHMGYSNSAVNHNQDKGVRENTHVQTIEGFWEQLKRGINGTHVHVSGTHLSKYRGKFEYRYNRRHVPHLMVDRFLFALECGLSFIMALRSVLNRSLLPMFIPASAR